MRTRLLAFVYALQVVLAPQARVEDGAGVPPAFLGVGSFRADASPD